MLPFFRRHPSFALVPFATLALAACAAEGVSMDEASGAPGMPDDSDPNDLSLGDLSVNDLKADGVWGAATTCKAIPDLPGLSQPEIFISLEGLTLRLVDRATGFEKVFPIGAGALDTDESSTTYGESLSMFPQLAYGRQDFEIRPTGSGTTACKVWWTDPANGQRLPVFAGLPFLSWSGSYGIHGPIDNYRAANGGSLRRGFVSHGCIRMESADVLEVYARIRRSARIPVRVQREPERRADGSRVDVGSAWIGTECDADSDCNFAGGFCAHNAYSEGRGFCSQRCTRTCPDRAGAPTTFCVADPNDATQGLCTVKVTPVNAECRPYEHMVARSVGRFGQPSVRSTVCVPGTRGWVGSRCFANEECINGATCAGASSDAPGLCTMACDRYCADAPGFPMTFCADDAGPGGSCSRRCTPASGASECAGGTACEERVASNNPARRAFVCVDR